MFLRITLVVSLVNICSCATPTYPEGKSNQAVYSQSFEREDVPLSYKYSAVHVYTSTPKKEPPHKLSNGIQFAPLPDQYDERPRFGEDFTKSSTAEQPTGSTAKINLEPKLTTSKSVYNNPIVSQYIHVIQTDRNPAYPSYQIPNTEKQNMGHYLDQFWSYEEPQRLTGSTSYKPKLVDTYTVQMTESPKPTLYTSISEPQPSPQINLYMNDFLNKELVQRQARKPYSAKVPQMHLNIGQGRKYQYPHQYQRAGKTHLDQARFYTYPVHAENFVNPQKKKSPSDSTKLLPLPNHLHLSTYSRT